MQPGSADHSLSPPQVTVPDAYNAVHDLLGRHARRADKIALIDAAGG